MSLTFTPHQRSAALPQGATAIDPAALEAPPPPHIDLSEIVSFTPILDSEDRRQVAAPAAIAASSNAQAELIRSFIGQVVCRLTNQRSYRGGWAHGTRHGFGDYTFSNGDRFQGFWCEGKKHGFGVYIFNDLDRYEGEWEEDQIQGQGTYIYANGNSFLGQWIRNEKHGRGTMNFKNGDSYEGTWVANRIEGPGRLLLGNGKEKAGLFFVHELHIDQPSGPQENMECTRANRQETLVADPHLTPYVSPEKNMFVEPLEAAERAPWYFFFNSLRMVTAPFLLFVQSHEEITFSSKAHQHRQTSEYWDHFLPFFNRWQTIQIDPRDVPNIPSVGTYLIQAGGGPHLYGKDSNPIDIQNQYDAWYRKTVQKVSQFLSSPPSSPTMLLDLLSILGYERHLIAFSTNTESSLCFGQWRLVDLFSNIVADGPIQFRAYAEPFLQLFGSDRTIGRAIQYKGQIGKLWLDLTKLTIQKEGYVQIMHTPSIAYRSAEKRKLIQEHLQSLLTHILEEQDEKTVVSHIASLHWWLAQLTLFTRGSASISEVLILGLFQHKGYRVEWKRAVSPDLEAMMRTEQEFIALYDEFILRRPTS